MRDESSAPRGSTLFSSLRYRSYRRVWAATVIDQTGNWLQITGRAWLIYHVTGSTASLGTVYFLSYLPQLLLSPFGGVVADRFDRRLVLMTGEVILGLGAAVMAVLASTDTANVVTVGALSLVLGATNTLTLPAQIALVPALVPREALTSAVSLTAATQATTRVLGPLLAGALIPLIGVAWVFWLNAASFVVILLVWLATPVARQPPMSEPSTVGAITAAARWVSSTPSVAVVVLTTFVVAGVGQVYQPLAVAYCTKVLADGDGDRGATYYGLFQAAIGVGAAIGIMALVAFSRRRPRQALLLSAVGCSVAFVFLGVARSLPLALGAALLIGVFQFALTTLSLTFVQHAAPEEMRGRIVALQTLCWAGPLPLIGLGGGALAAAIGLSATLAWFGVGCLAYCLVLLRLARWVPRTSIESRAAVVR